jgi:hypothetical protein
MMVRKILGCAHVEKAAVGSGDYQNVTVEQRSHRVRLSLTANSFPADLTPAEARHIAASLQEIADAVDAGSTKEPSG